MATWPYLSEKKIPTDIIDQQNGKIERGLLTPLSMEAISEKEWKKFNMSGSPGQYSCWMGHKLAVAAMELMVRAAAADGINIRVNGCYRDFASQQAMWDYRYQLEKPNKVKWEKQAKKNNYTKNRKLEDYSKQWNNKTYWLKER